jgi:hypothetical protein
MQFLDSRISESQYPVSFSNCGIHPRNR